MTNINFLCWNVDGIISYTPYLNHCLSNFDVHICGISEHWLREDNLNFLQTIDSNYTVTAKPVPAHNPFLYRSTVRGGVALMVHISFSLLSGIDTQSSRIVGAEIKISEQEIIFCFAVYLPASSRPFEVFSDHLEILETLVTVYSKRGRVIILGDCSVTVCGPRYQTNRDRRTDAFGSLLTRLDMISVHVQTICQCDLHTFFPVTNNSTAIDHIIIDSSVLDTLPSF